MENTKPNTDYENVLFAREDNGLKVTIETKRLIIRSYQDSDFDDCAKLYENEKLTKFFDHCKPRSRQEIQELINSKIKYFSNFEPFGLFSIFRKKDGAFIGQVDLMPFEEPGVVEVGCIFDRNYHNQGFCPEAIRAILFDYVNALNANGYTSKGEVIYKILATAHPKNHASKRIIKNLGMVFEKMEERFGHPRLWFYLNHKTAALPRWNAHDYCLNSAIQKDAASHLLKLIPWKGNERVLDVGCGDGKITAIIAHLIPNGHVSGIDISEEMIHFAQQRFAKNNHDNMDFSLGDARQFHYSQPFDIIFSSFALQWLKIKNSFFESAYNNLTKSGILLLTIPLGISAALEESIQILTTSPQWSSYFSTFTPEVNFLSEDGYKNLLSQFKFQSLQFTVNHHKTLFSSREDFEKYVRQWFVYLNALPDELKEVFFNQVIEKYLEIEKINGGEILFTFPRLDIMACKSIL